MPAGLRGRAIKEINMSDLIDRQAAIDLLKQMRKDGNMVPWEGKDVFARIRKLPSVQSEIIYCKDCKHWDGVDTCDVIDAPVWDNDFCSMAERRSDEE